MRIERMATNLAPDFIDVTWGAGGSTSDLTIEISTTAQNLCGVETQVHMTCTNMKKDDIKKALQTIKDNGLQNILALRGGIQIILQIFTCNRSTKGEC
jgi:methylenetetrahydrofolate reductase (NADPH)